MQILDGRLLLSASDLVNFLGCRHATYLDLRDLTNPEELPAHDAATVLIFEKGIEHEKRHLASLKARGLCVVEVPGEGFDIAERTGLTRETMRAGSEVIYQAALVAAPWLGYADFLERVEEASKFGSWSYEALDTKLPRNAKPEHVIQLATYSRLIGEEQGRAPVQMHVLLGNNKRVSLRVADFIHYHSIAQRRLETFAKQPPEVSTGEPCNHCRICRWSSRCEADWTAADHLTLVANITRHQIRRLWEGGISNVRALTALPAGSRVPGIQPNTLERLRHQATLQTAKRDNDANYVETLPVVAGKGFARLPRPDAGDIFFDMEGAQFLEDGSLEYLFGFITVDHGEPRFTAYWAHDREAEKRAFEAAMDFIAARLEAHPGAFVYHYASYEESALKRLAMVHGTRELQLDDLLRRRKLVDLYKVVREGVRISEPAYSPKNVEVFFGADRAGEVKTALDSMVVYDQWQQTGDDALLESDRGIQRSRLPVASDVPGLVATAASTRGAVVRNRDHCGYRRHNRRSSARCQAKGGRRTERIEDTTDNSEAAAGGHDLIAGTAWLFAREELNQQIDYLFVDEAGQVSLANTVAMGVSARNVILVGDQMQLSQPLKGSHPGQSGRSTLEHLLDGAATVPPERGIFLSKTRRMHPHLCRFISDAFYDGRLMAAAGNERQCLVSNADADPALAPNGLRFIGIEHEGCEQKSEPEAERVRQLYQSLLRQRWTDRKGQERRIGIADILVVSPYNMQVNLLRSHLPAGARVGTVDKFQGQEAAVVLISMATSSGDDLPRQIAFLYSRNRLNVAISRARCLAVIVASPRLLETSCSTIEQMRLVNALCWAKNFSERLIELL
jgi:predicted RecB family nuclease